MCVRTRVRACEGELGCAPKLLPPPHTPLHAVLTRAAAGGGAPAPWGPAGWGPAAAPGEGEGAQGKGSRLPSPAAQPPSESRCPRRGPGLGQARGPSSRQPPGTKPCFCPTTWSLGAAQPGHLLPRAQQGVSPCALAGSGARGTQPGPAAAVWRPGTLPRGGRGPGGGAVPAPGRGGSLQAGSKGQNPALGRPARQAGTGVWVGAAARESALWPPVVTCGLCSHDTGCQPAVGTWEERARVGAEGDERGRASAGAPAGGVALPLGAASGCSLDFVYLRYGGRGGVVEEMAPAGEGTRPAGLTLGLAPAPTPDPRAPRCGSVWWEPWVSVPGAVSHRAPPPRGLSPPASLLGVALGPLWGRVHKAEPWRPQSPGAEGRKAGGASAPV